MYRATYTAEQFLHEASIMCSHNIRNCPECPAHEIRCLTSIDDGFNKREIQELIRVVRKYAREHPGYFESEER
jgi:hypothetical protein